MNDPVNMCLRNSPGKE